MLKKISQFLTNADVPWSELVELYQALVSAGDRPDAAARQVAEFADEHLDFGVLVAGPIGQALELSDGPIFRLALRLAFRFTLRRIAGA